VAVAGLEFQPLGVQQKGDLLVVLELEVDSKI